MLVDDEKRQQDYEKLIELKIKAAMPKNNQLIHQKLIKPVLTDQSEEYVEY